MKRQVRRKSTQKTIKWKKEETKWIIKVIFSPYFSIWGAFMPVISLAQKQPNIVRTLGSVRLKADMKTVFFRHNTIYS